MRDQTNSSQPFKALGNRLRHLRQDLKESLSEVSGAVEIDLETLLKIEQGEERPSEDILLLLISHFDVSEKEASKLWELGGYSQPKSGKLSDEAQAAKSMVLVMPLEARIVYTDLVQVMVNNYGVVMNFMQNGGTNNQPMAVARVGMSKEHAHSVLKLLEQTLQHSKQPPKSLPSPDTTSSNSTPSS